MNKRVRLIISGDVQGVGYRSWCKHRALSIGLTGWVRNTKDGHVEIVAEGDKPLLDEFIRSCRMGPEVAWVEKVDSTWSPATSQWTMFVVRY